MVKRNVIGTLSPERAAAPEGHYCCKSPHLTPAFGAKFNPKKVKENNNSGKNGQKLNICTFNCQGLASKERLFEFENACREASFDIVGISECRTLGEKLLELKNGNYFYYRGDTKGYRGVGFYIHKKWTKKVIKVGSSSDRIGFVKLEIGSKVNLLIVQVYAPTMQAEEEEVEEFYEQLFELVDKEKEYYTVVMGDFNAKIGKEEVKIKRDCMGIFCSGDYTNSNGEFLIEFAERVNLKIMNTFYQKRKNEKWTWLSPDSRTKNEIDFCLCNDSKIVKDVCVW